MSSLINMQLKNLRITALIKMNTYADLFFGKWSKGSIILHTSNYVEPHPLLSKNLFNVFIFVKKLRRFKTCFLQDLHPPQTKSTQHSWLPPTWCKWSYGKCSIVKKAYYANKKQFHKFFLCHHESKNESKNCWSSYERVWEFPNHIKWGFSNSLSNISRRKQIWTDLLLFFSFSFSFK